MNLGQILKDHKYNYFQAQCNYRNEIFSKYGIWIKDLLDQTLALYTQNYENFETINYLLATLESTLKICDFLKEDELKSHTDVDKIIISHLISLAEATYKTLFKPASSVKKKEIIEAFLCSSDDKFENKIKGHKWHIIPYEKVYSWSEVLYWIRNGYFHEQDFLGKFFSISGVNTWCWYKKDWKTIDTECSITYKEFISLFLGIYKDNIEKFIQSNLNNASPPNP